MFKKKESGLTSMLTVLPVLFAVLALLLALLGFSEMVQLKLQADTIAKKYLYQIESYGYLSEANYEKMEEEYANMGVTILDTGTTLGESNRVPYGSVAILSIQLTFTNPLGKYFSQSNALADITVENTQTYNIYMEATAKW